MIDEPTIARMRAELSAEFDSIIRACRVSDGDVIVVGGRPLSGRSSILVALARELAAAGPSMFVTTHRERSRMYEQLLPGVPVASASSPGTFRARAVRFVICDNADHYDHFHSEGNPLHLLLSRIATYAPPKALIISVTSVDLADATRVARRIMGTGAEYTAAATQLPGGIDVPLPPVSGRHS